MANRQKSHFGSDGYRDVEVRREANKRAKITKSKSPLVQKRIDGENMVAKLRKEEKKLKGY